MIGRTILDDLPARAAACWAARPVFSDPASALRACPPAGYVWRRSNGEWTHSTSATPGDYPVPHRCETRSFFRVRRDGRIEAHAYDPNDRGRSECKMIGRRMAGGKIELTEAP